jgi:hypothetical protein
VQYEWLVGVTNRSGKPATGLCVMFQPSSGELAVSPLRDELAGQIDVVRDMEEKGFVLTCEGGHLHPTNR